MPSRTLRTAIAVGYFVMSMVMLVVAWLCLSFICYIGTSLLLITDPSMTTADTVYFALFGGAVAIFFRGVDEVLNA